MRISRAWKRYGLPGGISSTNFCRRMKFKGAAAFRRLAVNGKFLGAGFTGVHRVAAELVRELTRRPRELAELFPDRPCFVVPRNVRSDGRSSLEIERGGLFRGQLWEQL